MTSWSGPPLWLSISALSIVGLWVCVLWILSRSGTPPLNPEDVWTTALFANSDPASLLATCLMALAALTGFGMAVFRGRPGGMLCASLLGPTVAFSSLLPSPGLLAFGTVYPFFLLAVSLPIVWALGGHGDLVPKVSRVSQTAPTP